MTEELNWARMAARRRPSRVSGGAEVPVVEEISSTRKKKEEVLNQARAVLRQSQQFRPIAAANDKQNNNLSSKLAFQQQTQDDFWSPSGVVVDSSSLHQQRYNPISEAVRSNKGKKMEHEDDFGLPFRDAVRKSPISGFRSSPKIPSSAGGANFSQASSSSTTISMNTAELNVSSESEATGSDSESSASGSIASVKIKKTHTNSKKSVRMQVEPTTVRLTPLVPAPTAILPKSKPEDISANVYSLEDGVQPESGNEVSVPNEEIPLPHTKVNPDPAVGSVEEDELGFSRTHIKKSETDPHWFEKALLVRGEALSGDAYKSFKKAQAAHNSAHEMRLDNAEKRRRKPIFNNLTDPEYTADWISEADIHDNASEGDIEEIPDIPDSEYIEPSYSYHAEDLIDDHNPHYAENIEGDDVINLADDDYDVDTSSIIKTASVLEASEVIDEIASNLHSFLEISEKPKSLDNDFKMLAGEHSDAGEYDEAMEDENEPLKSIFKDVFENPNDSDGNKIRKEEEEALTPTKSVSQSSRSHKTHRRESSTIGNIWVSYEGDDYEDTFIQGSSTSTNKSTIATSKNASSISKTIRNVPSKDVSKSSASGITGTTGKSKKTSGSSSTVIKSKRRSDSVDLHSQTETEASSKSTIKSATSVSEKIKKEKPSKPSILKVATNKKEASVVVEREPHPSSRYQKNIKSILEKEVYQKELKRRRSQKIREERSQERRKTHAKESLDKNKKETWRDPSYTEILLPELFKYKSISGLQAAKAKRTSGVASPIPPSMNFGAPFFNFDGTIPPSEQMGSAGMLATAQVESLDIPDLVREVLASNERMYRMTIQAGKEMAKVYKNKVRAKTTTPRYK